MTDTTGAGYASPFEHAAEPEEPPRGTVLAYQRLGRDGAALDYVSVRAGDGLWYTTGRNAAQGVDWRTLWGAVHHQAHGPVRFATAWSELEFQRPAGGAVRGVVMITDPFADLSGPTAPGPVDLGRLAARRER